jgi:hypothetical protein
VSDALLELMRAIARGDPIDRDLDATPALATARLAGGATRQNPTDSFLAEISHYAYDGDTLLHIAAAAYAGALVGQLAEMGADVAAVNRRGQQPLHYAVDGMPGSPTWNAATQVETVAALLARGADPDAIDKNGTTPLMRAVRNRCALAVAALLDAGADPKLRNKRGSTAVQLAGWTTGRGGSGTPEAREQQQQIVALLGTRVNPE